MQRLRYVSSNASPEVRHAAEMHPSRGFRTWVADGDTVAVYVSNNITLQAGVDLVAPIDKSATRAREPFGRPLIKDQVLAIAASHLA